MASFCLISILVPLNLAAGPSKKQGIEFTDLPRSIEVPYTGSFGHTEPLTVGFATRRGNTYQFDQVVIGISAGQSGSFAPRYMFRNMGSGQPHKLAYHLYKEFWTFNFFLYDLYSYRWFYTDLLWTSEYDQETFSDSIKYYLHLPAGQDIPSGNYRDTLTYELWGRVSNYYEYPDFKEEFFEGSEYYGRGWRCFDSEQVRLKTRGEQYVDLVIVPEGGAYEEAQEHYAMDFGTLEPGNDSGCCDALIRASVGYTITAYSYGEGKLRHENNSVSERIPYTLLFADREVDLSGGRVEVYNRSQAPSGLEDRYPVVVEIGFFDSWIPAGDYHDSISFEITAN